MTILDRVGQQTEGRDMIDGKGKYLAYVFFQGQTDPAMLFGEMMWEPGAYYAGYHRHGQHETVMYVVSGTAEQLKEGDRCILEAGDAILVKSDQAQGIRNIGNEELRIHGFLAPGGELDPRSSDTRLPLPGAVPDWEYQCHESVVNAGCCHIS